jgi:hypothetical protein
VKQAKELARLLVALGEAGADRRAAPDPRPLRTRFRATQLRPL